MTPESLHTCPTCGIENFTERGLKAHKCKGLNRSTNDQRPVTNDPQRLALLAPQILAAHMTAKNMADQAVLYAAKAGALLNQAKELLPHGEFGKWVRKNLPGLSSDTAERYRKLADGLTSKIRTVRNLKASESDLSQLQLPDPRDLKSKTDNKVTQAVKSITDGKKLTQLYMDLGVIPPKQTKTQKGKDRLARAETEVAGKTPAGKEFDAAIAKVWADGLIAHLENFPSMSQAMTEEDLNRVEEALYSAARVLGLKIT